MTVENLKIAVENMSAYLKECHDEGDTIELTANVLKSIKENYEELINFKNKADFVEVVRCKDCKRFMPYDGEEHKGDCEEFSELNCCIYEDDFCSYGERK